MFRGSLVALVSPMNADTSLDWAALEELVEWHIAAGTQGIVAVGTTGESATLSVEEHVDVITRVVKQVAGRVSVIAGTGANSTSEALLLTKGAADAGADAALLVTPYYNKPSQEGLYLHHKTVADAISIPQLLYNVPGRTAVDMLPETIARLAEVSNIVGVKEATGDLQRLKALQSVLSDDFLLLSGDDETALDFMALGGHGVISVTANVAPRQMAEMAELVLDGRVEEARAIDEKLLSLHKGLFLESNPIPVKWATAQLGFGTDTLRLPLTPLSLEYREVLLSAMRMNSLIDN